MKIFPRSVKPVLRQDAKRHSAEWQSAKEYESDQLMPTGQTWAEFSNVDVGGLVYATQLHWEQKQPNLKLKTQPKQPLGYLLLAC